MTNLSRWQFYLKDSTSPDDFIDVSFYYMIAAALQRRCWIGANDAKDSKALFANLYIFLTGPPACGKGLIIKPVNELLRYWERDPTTKLLVPNSDKLISSDEQPIFALKPGPDASTYEKLIHKLARSTSSIEHSKGKFYLHASVFFALEELSSLFQIGASELPKFLLNGYDCGDYRRETIARGIDQVKRSCISILAGTTTSFLEEIFSESILTDGLSSRCWFVYAFGPRFHRWNMAKTSPEQLVAKQEILDHIKSLIDVYGEVTESPEASEYLRYLWEEDRSKIQVNNDIRLASYYGRKNSHLKKLCMAMLFSDQTESKVITIEIAQAAVKFLDNIERRSHHALTFGGKNPFANVAAKITQYLMSLPVRAATERELLDQFWSDLREPELKEVLKFMSDTKRIIYENNIASLRGFPNNIKTGKPLVELPISDEIPGKNLKALPLE